MSRGATQQQAQTQEQEQETARQSALRQGATLRALVEHNRSQERGDGPANGSGSGSGSGRVRGQAVDLEPGCAYGVVTRQMVNDLFEELRAIRARMDSLFSVIIGAIALDLLLRLAGLK